MKRNVLNDSPQSKLQAQIKDAALGTKLAMAQADIKQRQDGRPAQPETEMPTLPPVSPDLNQLSSQTVDDGQGNKMTVPEQEEEGFTAKLKRKLKEKTQEVVIDFLMAKMSPDPPNQLETHEQPGREPSKPVLGPETPQPERPEPQRPQPPAAKHELPKVQAPRVAPPKLGKIPRIM